MKKIKYYLKNIAGWSTIRKIVVFESDDWGSERVQSIRHYNDLLRKKIITDENDYNKYDALETSEDLASLGSVLSKYSDRNGNSPVFNMYYITSNPDYEKIIENNYETYEDKLFTERLRELGDHESYFKCLNKYLESKVFSLAYHGREHLCVKPFFRLMKSGSHSIKKSIDNSFHSIDHPSLPNKATCFRPSLFFSNIDEIPFIKDMLLDGIKKFKDIFKQNPISFCPPNGISCSEFDDLLFKNGIKAIVTQKIRYEPDGRNNFKKSYRLLNKKKHKIYLFRNCGFEPMHTKMNVEFCINQIEAAFVMKKPAIISTHRLNYNGSINPEYRRKGLAHLERLLSEVTKKWKNVEFVSTAELVKIMSSK